MGTVLKDRVPEDTREKLPRRAAMPAMSTGPKDHVSEDTENSTASLSYPVLDREAIDIPAVHQKVLLARSTST